MIKYVPSLTDIVLEEIPGRVSLAVEISNCRGNCAGCHSPFLKQDIGEELTLSVAERLIKDNFGANCFLLLGEGADREALFSFADGFKRAFPSVELAIYSGREDVEPEFFEKFDYVKTGPYIASLGPLNEITTNQRLYYHKKDITSKMWHKTNTTNE